jgi:hypothetical protein
MQFHRMSGIIARARDPSCLRARVHACRKKDGPKPYHSAEGPSEAKAEATESLPLFFSQRATILPQSSNIQTHILKNTSKLACQAQKPSKSTPKNPITNPESITCNPKNKLTQSGSLVMPDSLK